MLFYLPDHDADLKHREPLDSVQAYRDPNRLANYLAQTGQEDEPPEIVHAREMALAKTGLYANCTPIMAYYLAIGNQEAFLAEKTRQTATNASPQRAPKRAAAQKASAVWAELSPRKR
jgi:hypothetical protein